MAHDLIALGVLALIILGAIAGTGYLVWIFSAKDLDPGNFKRENKGRRRGDQ